MKTTNRQSGVALVSVLWLIALLSLIALGILALSRSWYSAAITTRSIVEAEALAEAAINRAIFDTYLADNRRRRDGGGHTLSYTIDGKSVSVAIRPENGKINLNRADEDLLSALFAANNVPEDEAIALAQAVVDWRDADDVAGLRGAEALEYRAAGYDYTPRNAPMEKLGELLMIRGMDRDLFVCIRPLITLYSTSPAVSEKAAPRGVLDVLDWADERQWRGRRWRGGASSGLLQGARSESGSAWQMIATVESAAGDFAMEAIVRITGNRQAPYWILEWRRVYQETGSCADNVP